MGGEVGDFDATGSAASMRYQQLQEKDIVVWKSTMRRLRSLGRRSCTQHTKPPEFTIQGLVIWLVLELRALA